MEHHRDQVDDGVKLCYPAVGAEEAKVDEQLAVTGVLHEIDVCTVLLTVHWAPAQQVVVAGVSVQLDFDVPVVDVLAVLTVCL